MPERIYLPDWSKTRKRELKAFEDQEKYREDIIRWVIGSVSHETIHLILAKLEGEAACTKWDNIDKNEKKHCLIITKCTRS